MSISAESIPTAALVSALPQKMRVAASMYLRVYTLCAVFFSIGGFLFGFDTGAIVIYLSLALLLA